MTVEEYTVAQPDSQPLVTKDMLPCCCPTYKQILIVVDGDPVQGGGACKLKSLFLRQFSAELPFLWITLCVNVTGGVEYVLTVPLTRQDKAVMLWKQGDLKSN